MRAFLPLLLWLIAAMGSGGMEALSQITGLKIVEGIYDFQADHTMVRAWGKSPIGLTWQVQVRWQNGRPKWILFSEPETEI